MTTPGYDGLEVGESEALVLRVASPWLNGVLRSALTVHDWAAKEPEATELRGRGAVHVVPAPVTGPDGRSRWAVRHYRRGGAIAAYLDDRYLTGGQTRPEREIRASHAARERGVPTPAVVAGVWYRRGLFYRADLVTEVVPDAATLADVLFEGDRRDDAPALLHRAGQLVRELGTKGIVHADLNAMNILISPGERDGSLHVIDLDRAWVTDEGTPSYGGVMLRRLERSLVKVGARSGRPLSEPEWAELTAGFEAGP